MEEVLIRFRLIGEEARALRALASEELRQPREQVRFLIRRELEERGLLPNESEPEHAQGVRCG